MSSYRVYVAVSPDLFPLPRLALQCVQNNDRTVVTDCVRFCVYVFAHNRTINPCYLHSFMLLALVTPKEESMILVSEKCVCVRVCVFIELHITAQSGPVILVILCQSH